MPKLARRARHGSVLAGAAALVLGGLAAPAPGLAEEIGPLVRVTGKSPFAGCRRDRVGDQTGTNYPNTEIEPWLTVNPRDLRNLLVGVQQDRWSNGGARGTVAVVSKDAGRTWRTVVPPGVSACAGGRYQRSSDPWVDFSPDGVSYFMSLVTDNDPPSGAFGKNGMVVNRSTDGGATWSRAIQLSANPVGQSLDDKNSLTADRTDARYVYAVWDRLTDFTLPPGNRKSADAASFAAATRGEGDVAGAAARARWLHQRAKGAQPAAAETLFTGPAVLARTTNGGRSWERPRTIYDPGPNAQTIGNQIVVLPGGTLLDFFTEILNNGSQTVRLIRSSDKGRTWSPRPTTVSSITFSNTGVLTPDEQEPVRESAFIADVAVNRATGVLYATWQDTRFRAVDEIAFSLSTDGGRHWTRPVKVNQTPANRANVYRQQAFVAEVEAAPDGRVVVTYYDFRNDRARGGELTDTWAVSCAANCSSAANWGDEVRLTARSFDMLDAPVARGHFLGDYDGLARAGNVVHAVFAIATADDVTNLYTRRIGFPRVSAAAE